MSRAKSKLLVVAVVAVGCACLLGAQSSHEAPPSAPPPKLNTACTECHDFRIIQQQRLSKAAWTKEVDKMIKWGAVVDPGDRDGFIEYLSSNFPPDKPVEVAPRAASGKR